MLRKRMHLVVFLLVTSLLSLGILGMDAFSLRSIDVEGCDRPEEILAMANIPLGSPIFRIDFDEVTSRIESSPYYEVLSVKLRLPSSVAISVRERRPAAAVHWLDAFHIIDQDGTILDTATSLPAYSYPVISGMQVDNWESGRAIASMIPRQTEAVGLILEALPLHPKATSYISEIDVGDPENIALVSPLGMIMNIGDASEIDRQMLWIGEVVPKLYAMGYTAGKLTLTAPGRSADFQPATSASNIPPPVVPSSDLFQNTPPAEDDGSAAPPAGAEG